MQPCRAGRDTGREGVTNSDSHKHPSVTVNVTVTVALTVYACMHVAAGVSWLMVYRTERFKRLKSQIEKESKLGPSLPLPLPMACMWLPAWCVLCVTPYPSPCP